MLLLTGCSGSSVASPLNPQRFLIVGDGFNDQGQNGALPSINDGSNTWLQDMAMAYSSAPRVAPAVAGGTAWAQAYAFLNSPDTVSGTNAPSVQDQINTMMASTSINNKDLVFINGGMADIVQAVTQYGISSQTTSAVEAAGSTLASQVRFLTKNGGTHVVVIGVYDVSISPWAASTGLSIPAISALTVAFNDQLLIDINDLGNYVLYLDAALFYNLVHSSPGDYGFSNVTTPACTTPNSLTCTPSTTVDQTNYLSYMFADNFHLTLVAQRMFGDSNWGSNGYQRLIDRW